MKLAPFIALLCIGCSKHSDPMQLAQSIGIPGTGSVSIPLTIVEKGQSNMAFFDRNGGAQEMRQEMGRQIIFIPCAVPGTSIAEWAPPSGTTQNRQTECTQDNASINVDVMLWYQGEQDAAACTPDWDRKFYQVIAYERSLHPNIKIVFAQLATTTLPGYPCWNNIKQQQATVGGRGIEMVKTDDLQVSPDGLHLGIPAQQELGKRYANAVDEMGS